MFENIQKHVFPFIKTIGEGKDTAFSRYMKDTVFLIPTPKRILPMSMEVAACFRHLIKDRKPPRVEPTIDGMKGFFFYSRNGKPYVGENWAHIFSAITKKYNSIYKAEIGKVTPHVCRHTYCSNMAKAGIKPKALQYLMGHSDIAITLNVYTHIKYEDAKEELCKLQLEG